MSSKTKIIVLHMKEVIYTAVFLVLAIALIILFFVMFGSGKKKKEDLPSSTIDSTEKYVPGVYTSSISLGDQDFDVQVSVTQNQITSITLQRLSETASVMYPLMEPSLDSLASQIYVNQSTEDLLIPDEQRYTSELLLSAINQALQQAAVTSFAQS